MNIKEIIKKGQLFEYMIGEKEYSHTSRDADVPTEDQIVFASLVALYKETNDVAIWSYFEATCIGISADHNYSWMALYYLAHCIVYSKKQDSYLLNLDKLVPVIISNIHHNKKYLSKNKKWVGANYNDGLWGDVKRMTENLNRRFELQIEL